jgi:hypothetical protein
MHRVVCEVHVKRPLEAVNREISNSNSGALDLASCQRRTETFECAKGFEITNPRFDFGELVGVNSICTEILAINDERRTTVVPRAIEHQRCRTIGLPGFAEFPCPRPIEVDTEIRATAMTEADPYIVSPEPSDGAGPRRRTPPRKEYEHQQKQNSSHGLPPLRIAKRSTQLNNTADPNPSKGWSKQFLSLPAPAYELMDWKNTASASVGLEALALSCC